MTRRVVSERLWPPHQAHDAAWAWGAGAAVRGIAVVLLLSLAIILGLGLQAPPSHQHHQAASLSINPPADRIMVKASRWHIPATTEEDL